MFCLVSSIFCVELFVAKCRKRHKHPRAILFRCCFALRAVLSLHAASVIEFSTILDFLNNFDKIQYCACPRRGVPPPATDLTECAIVYAHSTRGERTRGAARHASRLTFDSEQEHRVRSLAWEGAREGKERARLQAARINNWRARTKKNK